MSIKSKETVDSEFKEKLCWEDTDGKWFLNGTPNTVPDVRNFISSTRSADLDTLIEWARKHKREIKDCGKCNSCEMVMSCEVAEQDRQFNSALQDLIQHLESCKKIV